MKNPPQDSHVERRFAATALMLGNFITGTSVLPPAGMLSELSGGLQVSIRDAGLLITSARSYCASDRRSRHG
jgi:predicted MFS family arabinose efflux permease